MAVRIRLTRVGATKRPSYRVVAIDSRRPRDGRALEILGFYDPLTDPATVQLDAERVTAWIDKGARPSDTVVKLMRQAGMAVPAGFETVARPTDKPKQAPKKPPKAASKPAAATEATTEAPTADEAAASETEPAAETGATQEATAETPAEEAEA